MVEDTIFLIMIKFKKKYAMKLKKNSTIYDLKNVITNDVTQ